MKNLGETIKSLRLEREWTQMQLAKKVGVSYGMISMWENNVNEPKAFYVKKLAQVFEISTDYLLNMDE